MNPQPTIGTERTREAEAVRIEDLVAAARALIVPGGRRVLGITGAPGSGKSTLGETIVSALGDQAVLVGLDGFHLANAELDRLGRRARKGAADTFDAAGYVNLLRYCARRRTRPSTPRSSTGAWRSPSPARCPSRATCP